MTHPVNYLSLGKGGVKVSYFYGIFTKVDGFETPSLKIDRFGCTPSNPCQRRPCRLSVMFQGNKICINKNVFTLMMQVSWDFFRFRLVLYE